MYFHAVGDPKIAFSSQNQETKTTPKVTLLAFSIDCRIVQALSTQLFGESHVRFLFIFMPLAVPKQFFRYESQKTKTTPKLSENPPCPGSLFWSPLQNLGPP
jgi:hypothetical protein